MAFALPLLFGRWRGQMVGLALGKPLRAKQHSLGRAARGAAVSAAARAHCAQPL